MAEGLNRWMGLGNLAADPELRVTGGGQAVLKFRLACTETYLDRNSAKQERTEWVSCVLWGKRAEGLAKYMAKGDRVYVEGRLQTTSWEKDGEKRYRTEINVTDVRLLGGKGDGAQASRGNGGGRSQSAPRAAEPAPAPEDPFGDYGVGDSDIPF